MCAAPGQFDFLNWRTAASAGLGAAAVDAKMCGEAAESAVASHIISSGGAASGDRKAQNLPDRKAQFFDLLRFK